MSEVDKFSLSAQVGRARQTLGVALGQTQDVGQIGSDISFVNRGLAGAVKALYKAESSGLSDAGDILAAMDHLRATLGGMQDLRISDDSFDTAMSSVAKILAMLFPVYETLSRIGVEAKAPLQPSSEGRAHSRRLKSSLDRRSYPRKAIEADIGIQSETNFYTGFSADISSGGLFVATFDIPPIGTALNVNFSLPDGQILSLDGTVRWVREYNELSPDTAPGFGIQFDNLTDEQERDINKYISLSTPLFYEH